MITVNRHQKQAALKPHSLWLTPKTQSAAAPVAPAPKAQLSIREIALARLQAQKSQQAA